MKKEHIQELIRVADVYIRDAEREIRDLTQDGAFGKYTEKLIFELRNELEKWTEIKRELVEMLIKNFLDFLVEKFGEGIIEHIRKGLEDEEAEE